MYGQDLIYAGWGNPTYVFIRDSYRRIAYEFTRGEKRGNDNVKLNWAKDRKHESLYNNMNFDFSWDDWTDNGDYYSMTVKRASW
tara:strand:- start:62 stop:313 length:252 start_codon:yes stop_codon:yes gene_type:complete